MEGYLGRFSIACYSNLEEIYSFFKESDYIVIAGSSNNASSLCLSLALNSSKTLLVARTPLHTSLERHYYPNQINFFDPTNYLELAHKIMRTPLKPLKENKYSFEGLVKIYEDFIET